jgi:hypothetical protein
MDLSRPEFSYVFLIIPLLFALAILAQGFSKMANRQSDGPVAAGFGVLLLVLIASAWFFFIR